MLKISSTFPVPFPIDGELVTLDVKRFTSTDETLDFLFSFERITKEAALTDGTDEEKEARERYARTFMCEAFTRYISLAPGQIEADGEAVVDGAGLVRAFAGRQEILSRIFATIRYENVISTADRAFNRAMLAPFVPTPPEVIDAMLDAAGILAPDEGVVDANPKTVIDIGCGPGDLLIAAARRGAKAIGYEMHAGRAREALRAASEAGVSDRVHIHQQDASTVPADVWRQANAVLMYLLPEPHKTLGAKLKTALLPGARVVCHAYPLGPEWPTNGTRFVPAPATDNMTPENSKPMRIDASVGWVYSYEVP